MDDQISLAISLMDRAHRLLAIAGDDDLASRLEVVIQHGRSTRPMTGQPLDPELAALVEAIPLPRDA